MVYYYTSNDVNADWQLHHFSALQSSKYIH